MSHAPTHPEPQPARVWLVTGCSSGLGRTLVTAILARGDKVIATARRIADLDYVQELPGAQQRALTVTLDVTDSFERLHSAVDQAVAHFGAVDVLVNNAGFVVSGVWEELSHEDTHRQFETNFFGAINVTRCILPHFRKARSGVILFMGSIAGCMGVSAGGPYSASKFALDGAAQCLAKETAHLGIRTHVLVLGQFRTDILDEKRKGGVLQTTNLSEYDSIKAEMSCRHQETHGKQPGNPVLAVQRILDIVRVENLTKDQETSLPLHIPLGTDALDVMRHASRDTLESLQTWERFAASTDFAEHSTIASYLR